MISVLNRSKQGVGQNHFRSSAVIGYFRIKTAMGNARSKGKFGASGTFVQVPALVNFLAQ